MRFKKHILIAGAAVFWTAVAYQSIFGEKRNASAPPSVPTAAQAAEWRSIKTWTGDGIKETESFATASREWRISWSFDKEQLPGGWRLSDLCP